MGLGGEKRQDDAAAGGRIDRAKYVHMYIYIYQYEGRKGKEEMGRSSIKTRNGVAYCQESNLFCWLLT